MHDFRKLIPGLAATAAFVAVAGSAQAQGPISSFSYSTTVNNNAAGSTLASGPNGYVYATGVPGTGSGTPLIPYLSSPQTGLAMANFNIVGDGGSTSSPFTIQLTVHAPIIGGTTAPVQDITANLHGTFSSVAPTNFYGIITGLDLVTTGNNIVVAPVTNGVSYNFGQYGTYTFSNFKYVKNPANGSDGLITADEAFAPVPEPSSVAAFAFTGVGAMGLMLRARKARRSTAA